uniref:protein-serine/threonine phosphatase n=1 Tax=Oryza barthii TaxID=65489 RepID=A0A0D3F0S7_9ORYZ
MAISGEVSGTTATLVVINGFTVTVESVGDSRCILDTQGGELLTVDHCLEKNAEEREQVSASGGEVGRLNLFGVLGWPSPVLDRWHVPFKIYWGPLPAAPIIPRCPPHIPSSTAAWILVVAQVWLTSSMAARSRWRPQRQRGSRLELDNGTNLPTSLAATCPATAVSSLPSAVSTVFAASTSPWLGDPRLVLAGWISQLEKVLVPCLPLRLLLDTQGPSAKTCEGAAGESGYRRGATVVKQQLYSGRISAVVRWLYVMQFFKQVDKSSKYYEFRCKTRLVKPSILHFQNLYKEGLLEQLLQSTALLGKSLTLWYWSWSRRSAAPSSTMA